jgi:phosphatidylethanolamine-binding protein (PEBP) family uncharacterized protein
MLSRTQISTSAIAALVALGLGGCSNSSPTTTSNLAATGEVVTVPLTSSAIRGTRLPAQYTCDGRDVSPPLHWGAIPAGVKELALFAISVTPSGRTQIAKSVEWAIAGVNPALHGIAAGQVPAGAFVLTSSNGKKRYSICPTKGKRERYIFALYALPSLARAAPQIPGNALLHNLTQSSPQYEAPARGAFAVSYTRR